MKKILLIDDDEYFAKSLCSSLSYFDFEVKHIHDYYQIDIELYKGYDGIILDIVMPLYSDFFSEIELINANRGLRTGILLHKRIRNKYPQIPVIFYTTSTEKINCDEKTVLIRKPQFISFIAKTLNDLIYGRIENLY